MRSSGFLEHNWYYVGIAAMFIVGWKYQSVGLWMKSIGITPYLIALAFFLNGFALSAESLLGSVKQWRILVCALLIVFGVSPALVFALRQIIPGGHSLIGDGFQILAIVPILFVSPVVLTRMAKGNAAVALYLIVASNLLAIVVAPLLIKLTLGTSGAGLDIKSTMVNMFYTVLLPTALGQVSRKKWEMWAREHAKLITTISQCTILIFIISGISALPKSAISSSVALTTLAIGVAMQAVLLGIGSLGGHILKTKQPERRALIFCTAQKSFVFNILLCGHVFGGHSTAFGLAVLPGIIYYLIALTVGSIIAQHWSTQPEMMNCE
jgi:sodium/bile acid cotransporter 7